MADRYGEVAAWAREAGYDGVQLGSANAKLLDQFLSPFYNRRTDEFGGSLEAGARVLRLIRDAVAERAGRRLPLHGEGPGRDRAAAASARATGDEALRAVPAGRGVGLRRRHPGRGLGVPRHDAVARRRARLVLDQPGDGRHGSTRPRRSRLRRAVIKAGAWWGGKRAPFGPVWNRELFTAAHATVDIPVFAVGGIRTADEVRDDPRRRRGRHGRHRPTVLRRARPGRDASSAAIDGPGRCRELESVRPGPDARHEGRLLQPRGAPESTVIDGPTRACSPSGSSAWTCSTTRSGTCRTVRTGSCPAQRAGGA